MDMWLMLFLILFWSGPIGLGVFLAGLGVYYWGMAQKRASEKKE
jgi:hypothetical protein